MEEENNKRETRRSRSKTPLTLRSSVDRDVGTDGDKTKKPVKKNPVVETITEEKESPAVPAQAAPGPRSARTKRNAAKVITSDYSSDGSIESARVNKETVALIASSVAVVPSALTASEQQVTTVTKTTTVTTTKKSVKGSDEPVVQSKSSGAVTSSTTKTTRSSNRETEQNESNVLLEKLRTSTPRQASASANVVSSFNDISTTNGVNLEEHVPFKEYRDAGEYWNKYPKTDYTYSKLSQQRREIKPGVLAMPNMSRRSLEHHHERVNQMIQNNPSQESFLRTRYESFLALRKRRSAADYSYDSQDEIDLSQFGKNSSYTTFTSSTSATWLRRLFTAIITFFSSIYTSATSIFRRKQSGSVYYSRYATQEKRGIFGRIGQSISNAVSTVFRHIYLVISSVLFLDSWLLRSSNVSGGKKKGILIGLLVLLPLLLIGAYNLSEESDQLYYRSHLRRVSALPSINSLASIDFGSSFADFTSRTSKVIPIALALIRTETSNVGQRLKFLFDFNWNWLPLYTSSHSHITNNIKTSLSPDEYNNMLKHINAYIETVVAEKLQKAQEKSKDEKIDPKIALYIATIVKENIIEHKYVLSDEDVERIAEIVRLKLAKERDEKQAVPFVLSQENLEEISRIVKQNIEIHRHEWHSLSLGETIDAKSNDPPAVDVDEILFKILTSPKLGDLFDDKIASRLHPITLDVNTHQVSIDQIRGDLELIKDKLSSAFEGNKETRNIVAGLKADQGELEGQMHTLQNQQNEQYEKLLNEIDLKLSSLSANQFDAIDEHIRSVLVEIIGFKSADGQPLQNGDITNWIRNVFVAKELLETRLNELNEKFENKLSGEINQSAQIIIKDVSEKIKQEFLLLTEKPHSGEGHVSVSLDEKRIKDIIREALAVYDADKTGMVDFALESSGGQVLSTRCTESFQVNSAQISIFGIPLWYTSNTPRTVISPAVHPGECWAFQGFPGFLVLKLNHNIFVTGFTMEHIPKSLAPNHRIDSAPKFFTVWGLESENDQEPFSFGEYEYTENGTSLQYFAVKNTELQNVRSHNIVELRIESNHGNINYTCLYRFRVHGTITPTLS